MIEDIEDAPPVEADEAVDAVLTHAALHLLTMEPELAQRVRAALTADAKDNPRLANDADQVGRLVDRYIRVAAQGDVKPASELMGL